MSASEAMRGWSEKANRVLAHRAAPWLLLLTLAALYTAAYVGDEMNPGDALPALRRGWWSWADQTKYVEAAQMLADGRVDARSYYYPLGYSAIAAPFVRAMPSQPFFWPDLACVLASAAFAWRLARRWLTPLATLVVAIAFIATHASLLRLTMVIPWNTLPTMAALLAGMWLVLERRGGAAVGWLSLIAALTYWVRPGDAACFAPMLVWATLRLPTWRARLGWGALGVGLIAASAGAMAWLNLRIFGHWRTPYEQGTFENIGFFSYPFAHKLYWLLVDGAPFFGERGTALLWRYPWLFLAVPGVVFWLRRDGWAAAACVGTIALNWVLYFNYNDFFPSGIFRFSLIHYLSWAFVPLAIAAVAAVCAGWRELAVRFAAGGALVLFVVVLGVRLKERPLTAAVVPGAVTSLPAARPLWMKFPGERIESLGVLRLDGRVMQESGDFQLPYVPGTEARMLLSARAQGHVLAPAAGERLAAVPQVGDFGWTWWPQWRRLAGWRD